MTLDDEDIEAIAARVAEKLERRVVGLVDAAELARILGVSKGFLDDHAETLGARRLGAGRRARLRFDAERAVEAAATLGKTQQIARPSRTRGRPRKSEAPVDIDLLEPRRR